MTGNKPGKLWGEWDGEYIGNIWGWKFSFISLAIILFFVLLMWYRHSQLPDVPVNPTEQQQTSPSDSIGIKID